MRGGGRGETGALAKPVAVAFLATRAIWFLLGIRFDPSPLERIQHHLDVSLLSGDLAASLWRLHSQPPGWNAFLGVVLSASPSRGVAVAVVALVQAAAGYLVAYGVARLAVALGAPRRLALAAAILWMASPASILYENCLIPEIVVVAMLVAAALALQRFAEEGRFLPALGFFALVGGAILTRSLLHLAWFAVPLAAALVARRGSGRVVAAAALPLAAAALWFAKNLLLFGFFGSSSWFGLSAARMTVFRIPGEERRALAARGDLSPVAGLPPFSAPERYLEFVPLPPVGHPVLDELRKSTGQPNYNHRVFPEVSRRAAADAAKVLRERPAVYAGAVAEALWHATQPASDFTPFGANLEAIDGTERAFSFLVLGQPFRDRYFPTLRHRAPVRHFVGMLAGLPLLALGLSLWAVVGAARRLPSLLRDPSDRPRGATTLFLLGTIAWVVGVGCLLEVGENNRFRFLVDPFLLVLVAVQVAGWLGWAREPERAVLGRPGRSAGPGLRCNRPAELGRRGRAILAGIGGL